MSSNTYHAIGLMSGTSVDGLDIAACTFELKGRRWSFSLQCSKSVDYNEAWKQKLKNSVNLSRADLDQLNIEYGQWLGLQVNQFMHDSGFKPDFIASHGHTVFHQPEVGLTYQIGDGQQLANTTQRKIICDFRSKDVSLGGQGAPLVPIGDMHLFSQYQFCLNLGGISNMSFTLDGERVAYDIGLANMILNYITQQIDLQYDKNGKLAKSGRLNDNLFRKLNDLDYYKQPFPKSTGYEWFLKKVIPLVESFQLSIEDKLHTAVRHIAYTIGRDVMKFASNGDKILVTGGGAKNAFLIQCLNEYLGERVELVIPEAKIIEFKEAIVFAFLGVLHERNEVNCLQSVTGAREDSCGGVVFNPN